MNVEAHVLRDCIPTMLKARKANSRKICFCSWIFSCACTSTPEMTLCQTFWPSYNWDLTRAGIKYSLRDRFPPFPFFTKFLASSFLVKAFIQSVSRIKTDLQHFVLPWYLILVLCYTETVLWTIREFPLDDFSCKVAVATSGVHLS